MTGTTEIAERRRSRRAAASLALVCLAAATQLPRTWSYFRDALPALLAWTEPATQHRLTYSGEAYDFLAAADALVPPRESLLLLTPGVDARKLEYTVYHRALYRLTPRRITWAAPAARDATWETRLLHPVELTADSLRAAAAAAGARCLLAWNTELPDGTGVRLRRFAGGSLWRLPGAATGDCLRAASADPRREFATAAEWLRLPGALLTLLAIGGALVAAATRHGAPGGHGPEGLARAWLAGAGAISCGWALFSAGGASRTLRVAAVGIALLASLVVLGRRVRGTFRRSPAERRRDTGTTSPWAALLVTLLVVQALFVFVVAVGRPLWIWDSWATWGSKARAIFLAGAIGPEVYSEPTRTGTLLSYPLHYPLNEAWLYAWLGTPDDRIAGLVAALSWLALLALVHGAATRWGAGRLNALAAAVAVGATPIVAGTAAYAFADVPFAALAAWLAIGLVDRGRLGEARASGVGGSVLFAAALLPWTKREGWLLLACLAAAVWVAGPGAAAVRRTVVRCCAAGALTGGLWFAFVRLRGGATHVGDFAVPSGRPLVAALGNLPRILRLEAGSLVDPAWALLWLVAAVWFVTEVGRRLDRLWRKRSRRLPTPARRETMPSSFLPLTIALYFTLLTLAFTVSSYSPLEQHVLTSFYRLSVHVAPLFVLWLASLTARTAPDRSAPSGTAVPDAVPVGAETGR